MTLLGEKNIRGEEPDEKSEEEGQARKIKTMRV